MCYAQVRGCWGFAGVRSRGCRTFTRYVDNNKTPTVPVRPSDSICFCLHHLLKHPGSVQGAVMCDNASPGCRTCACATPSHRYGRRVGARRSLGTCGWRGLVLMGGQKALQGTPSDHAAVGLEPCLRARSHFSGQAASKARCEVAMRFNMFHRPAL